MCRSALSAGSCPPGSAPLRRSARPAGGPARTGRHGRDRAASRAARCSRFFPRTPRSGRNRPCAAPETAPLVALRAVCLGNHPRAKPERHENPYKQGRFAVSAQDGIRSFATNAYTCLPRNAAICDDLRSDAPAQDGGHRGRDGSAGRMFGSSETNTDRHGVREVDGSSWKRTGRKRGRIARRFVQFGRDWTPGPEAARPRPAKEAGLPARSALPAASCPGSRRPATGGLGPGGRKGAGIGSLRHGPLPPRGLPTHGA